MYLTAQESKIYSFVYEDEKQEICSDCKNILLQNIERIWFG